MKWIIGIVIFIFVGWKASVFLMNNAATKESIVVTDSLPSQHLSDTTRIDSLQSSFTESDPVPKNNLPLTGKNIDTKNIQPQQVVDFANTLLGIPYLYGSTDPAKGFDCSGFITYVFNHFNIAVPRSSIDFTNVGIEVNASSAKPGDLILFRGTDSLEKFVGHMGIVVAATDSLHFIHSTSGKKYGVTITALNDYYKGRYVKTVRLFQ